jgi:hypothetical protein
MFTQLSGRSLPAPPVMMPTMLRPQSSLFALDVCLGLSHTSPVCPGLGEDDIAALAASFSSTSIAEGSSRSSIPQLTPRADLARKMLAAAARRRRMTRMQRKAPTRSRTSTNAPKISVPSVGPSKSNSAHSSTRPLVVPPWPSLQSLMSRTGVGGRGAPRSAAGGGRGGDGGANGGSGDTGGAGGRGGGRGGCGGGETRGPQSKQSVPYSQSTLTALGPPSSQFESDA